MQRGRLDELPEKGEKGSSQSDEQWNCFKGKVGETSESRSGAHMGFSDRKCINLKLELNRVTLKSHVCILFSKQNSATELVRV